MRVKAAWALGQICDDTALDDLLVALDDADPQVRWSAANSLGMFGPKAARGVPKLSRALHDSHTDVRWAAAWSLGEIGEASTPAVPALGDAVGDADVKVRKYAVWALSKLGSTASPAIMNLIDALRDPDPEIRYEASRALKNIGDDLQQSGVVLWWVVPRAYFGELVGLFLLLAGWFALAGRVPRHRPASTPKHIALVALTAAVPSALACSAVYFMVTREWAQGFLPDAVTLVPFPIAAVLSAALFCVLPAVWVCQRKTLAAKAVHGPIPPVEPTPSDVTPIQ